MQPVQAPNSKGRWGMVTGLAVLILSAGGGTWLALSGKLRVTPESKRSPMPSMSMPMTPSAPPDQPETTEIVIPSESLPRLHLGFAKVSESTVSPELRVPGTVQPNGYREVHVTPIAAGVVTQVSGELGQAVKRGQPLSQLFSRDLTEAQTAFVAFNAQLQAEHKKLQRTQELVRLGAASREELETVDASHRVHSAHVEEARQRLLLLGLSESQISEVSAGRKVSSNIT